MDFNLERIIQYIKTATGLEVCIFDLAYFSDELPVLALSSEHRVHGSPFCKYIKTKKAVQKEKCVSEELLRLEAAREKRETIIHTCYAGVTDMITPIFHGTRIIGGVFLGQIILEENAGSDFLERFARELGYDSGRLIEYAGKQGAKDMSVLYSHRVIAEFLARFVEVSIENEMLRKLDGTNAKDSTRVRIDPGSIPNQFLVDLRAKAHSRPTQSILDLIMVSYWEERTFASYAEAAGVSQSVASRILKRETGISFRKIIKKARALGAAYLLKKYDVNVSEAGYVVGYQNAFSFSRAFREAMGMTPSEYARRHQSLPI